MAGMRIRKQRMALCTQRPTKAVAHSQETDMLTTDQKEAILREAGVATPAFPSPGVLWRQQRQHDAAPGSRTNPQAGMDPGTAAKQWAHAINTLYVEYSAARAARSLRKAE